MDQETIENHIKNLGKRDFDAVATVILTKFYKLNSIDVDGKGDGGSDFRSFHDEKENRTLAIQRTVQDYQWETKAFNDAKKAKEQLGALRYFFLTSRAHESTALRSLENRISAELNMSAVCLGATELAGFIFQQGLLKEFAEAIGLPLNISVQNRPDSTEILLHAYIAMGADRSNLQQEIYDDTLLLALHLSPEALERDNLIKKAVELLGDSSVVEERLDSRIDSLLTRGIIQKISGDAFTLNSSKQFELKVADGIYQQELIAMASAQSQVLLDLCDLEWDVEQCTKAATLLARWFIQRQLITAEHASIAITKVGLSRTIGNPEQDLDNLLMSAGVPAKKVADVINEFVRLASNTPLIKKLSRAVTYVATEGMDLLKASKVLGASNWSDVIITLDASVAIPYLCASLFRPTQGRFSKGATTCINLLRKVKARLVIPRAYINEIAAHLVRALNYPELEEFSKSLEYSENGFVAFYYQLKATGHPVPANLRQFVGKFAKSTLRASFTSEDLRLVMADVQPLLSDYEVTYDEITRIPEHFRKEVETSYSYRMEILHRTKSQNLVKHDVEVLSNSRRAISQRSEVRMCLTWDAVMIAVGQELEDCGWIVSPHEACDFIQSKERVSESQLSALAHSLAKVRERPSEFGARIIDRVVQLFWFSLKWKMNFRLV
jgi:hypothetical protein